MRGDSEPEVMVAFIVAVEVPGHGGCYAGIGIGVGVGVGKAWDAEGRAAIAMAAVRHGRIVEPGKVIDRMISVRPRT